ncbi:MAG: hypothetical protein EOP84_09985 [Verrucomicrobiaceae bacterium]|nr:MAG: hypothetical protein EOP84_09985 [Verrucomicrobiaceae bacterium]
MDEATSTSHEQPQTSLPDLITTLGQKAKELRHQNEEKLLADRNRRTRIPNPVALSLDLSSMVSFEFVGLLQAEASGRKGLFVPSDQPFVFEFCPLTVVEEVLSEPMPKLVERCRTMNSSDEVILAPGFPVLEIPEGTEGDARKLFNAAVLRRLRVKVIVEGVGETLEEFD